MRQDLWDFALSLPVKYKADRTMGKLLFREAALPYVGAEIAFREKKGFPVPVRKWMRLISWSGDRVIHISYSKPNADGHNLIACVWFTLMMIVGLR